MPKHRFYIRSGDWEPQNFRLLEEEAHHCRDVMRCGVGDVISVFDGLGREAEATIEALSKRSVPLKMEADRTSDPLPAKITLGQAIPKGKNMDLIIQKATELGVAKVVPLLTTNTVVKLDDHEIAKKQEKWQRIAIEACKQCGQNWLPEVAAPQSVESFVQNSHDDFKIIAAIDSQSLSLKEIMANWDAVNSARPTAGTILIGPEGDFTLREVETASNAGFRRMSLGPIILRSETAAIYAASVLAYELMNR